MNKLLFYSLLCIMFVTFSCEDDDNSSINFADVSVQLIYPDSVEPAEGVDVSFTSSSGNTSTSTTDETGMATASLAYDVYDITVSDSRSIDGSLFSFNGSLGSINVDANWDNNTPMELELTESESGQVIIKELYIGGCPNNDGSDSYKYDNYVIVYNNSNATANLDNLSFSSVAPLNSNSSSPYSVDGQLSYLSEGWVPAAYDIIYAKIPVSLEPGEQMVIALNGAIDHTQTYSQSVNLANPDYWVLYDNGEVLTHKKYVSPDASIPTDHYFGIQKWSFGNAFVYSDNSPAFFLCTTKGSSPSEFASSTTNSTEDAPLFDKMMSTDWILDGVEVFRYGYDNYKRFGDDIDAGSVMHETDLGYTIYRNVDETATKAIEGNEELLVYNYSHGTIISGVESTDPSGIDAEASIANGARIIYMDTNNSSNDFHLRNQASLRD